MKCFELLSLALLAAVAGAAVAAAEEAKQEPSFQEKLEQWLPGMGAEKVPDRRGPQQELQNLVFQLGTPGREAELTAVCKAISEKIGPETAQPARVWLLRQLEFNAGAECVDAVAKVLDDGDKRVREAACRALQNNPAPQANAKLIAKLQSTSDNKFKLGLLNGLGFRADASSAAAVAKELANADKAVAAAAARALGKIGTPQAAKALAAARPKADGDVRFRICDAYLRCADKLLAQGKTAEAAAMYKQLNTPQESRAIRMAAIQGMLKAAGGK